jgi:hypothetical protein
MPWGQIPLSLYCFPTGTGRIAMKRAWNSNYAYALLVWLSVFSGGSYASTLMERSRASKTHAGSEPFATFHLLDRQLSLLGRQSAVLQKTVSSPQPGNLKAAKTWRKAATDMGQTVNRIEKLAHNLQRRYRGKPFARRLFGRLSAHAASVQSALRVVRSADSPVRARAAASEVDKGIVSLSLQYNAITGGYAALHCAPGEWTCCEPKRQGEASSPDACRWLCTKKAQRCRGFVGLRAAEQK